MRISRTHRFIFFHVPRTGGSSIAGTLDDALFVRLPRSAGPKAMSKFLPFVRRPLEKTYLRPHERAVRARRLLPPDVFDGYRKVAFVRNPYSWLVSLYEVRRRGPNHRHHRIVAAMRGFSEYVDWEIARSKRFQYGYLTDGNGELLIDLLGRYERLAEDHRRIFELLGVEASGLGHVNSASRQDYRAYYDEETRRKVAEHWARDIELFGYDFDGLSEDRFPLP